MMDFSVVQKLSSIAWGIVALQHGQLIYGNSITLAAMVKVKSLLGIKALGNAGYHVYKTWLTDFLACLVLCSTEK